MRILLALTAVLLFALFGVAQANADSGESWLEELGYGTEVTPTPTPEPTPTPAPEPTPVPCGWPVPGKPVRDLSGCAEQGINMAEIVSDASDPSPSDGDDPAPPQNNPPSSNPGPVIQ